MHTGGREGGRAGGKGIGREGGREGGRERGMEREGDWEQERGRYDQNPNLAIQEHSTLPHDYCQQHHRSNHH